MEYDEWLQEHGIRPTGNRIVIARELGRSRGPLSMSELERRIGTIDKSNISRTLAVFREHHLVHTIEDGEGQVKYELCMSHDDDGDDDTHAHFFCERCHRTICLYDVPVPDFSVPEGYVVHGANCLLVGICPDCRKKMVR